MSNPREIATGDQHYANLSHQLDGLIAGYANDPDSYLDRLDGFAEEFTNSDHFTDPTLQLQTLSQLLAVAIHRLSNARRNPADMCIECFEAKPCSCDEWRSSHERQLDTEEASMEVGDRCYVARHGTGQVARVMAVAEGYAMLRYPSCAPFAEAIPALIKTT